MGTRSLLAAALSAVAVAALGAGSAFAGEVTGNGKATGAPAHTNSICAFSGRNDGEPPEGRTAPHVQNWGQETKEARAFFISIGFHPGQACNGKSGLLAGGGEG